MNYWLTMHEISDWSVSAFKWSLQCLQVCEIIRPLGNRSRCEVVVAQVSVNM
jgi:hypothetical protein